MAEVSKPTTEVKTKPVETKPADPKGYILNRIFRDQGTSKRLRLDEISHSQLQRTRKEDENESSPYTAADVAKAVIEAAVIQDEPIRNLLNAALTLGLNTLVKDPTNWEAVRLEWANKDDETYKADHRTYEV